MRGFRIDLALTGSPRLALEALAVGNRAEQRRHDQVGLLAREVFALDQDLRAAARLLTARIPARYAECDFDNFAAFGQHEMSLAGAKTTALRYADERVILKEAKKK